LTEYWRVTDKRTDGQTDVFPQHSSLYALQGKNCFPTTDFTEIGQSDAELWPKTIFNMAAVRHF